ncbi:MAG: phosphoribosyl-ATP diphosphatase [Rhodobiaceae bacterium]|nr:phosphoribosyl-ATP diphosphatase [Rhodobiaceae bacterium]
MSNDTIKALAATIRARRAATAEKSYTKSLLEAGVSKCARKFGEEAVETVIAALEGDRAALTGEAADVIYHLMVLLEASDCAFDEVLMELERRMGQSGHEEKAARSGSFDRTGP